MEFDGRAAEEEEKLRDSLTTSLPSPHNNEQDAKAAAILAACKWKDTEALKVLATSQCGLLSDDARRQAWPLLLGCKASDEDSNGGIKDSDNWKSLPKHDDEDQVRLDVDRSFIYYPEDQSSKEISRRKEELSDLITEVLRRHPYLCYFQGYHDICQVFLLVLDPGSRAPAVARLSALRIRDFMLPTLAPALAQLRLIPAILYAVDPMLCSHLSQTQPFFALSGTLTMYAHDIQEYGDIARLFDAFLARETVFSVYMFAQIALQRSEELFETPADEPEMLHSILSKLPKPLDLEALITNTVKLFKQHPPESLRGWRSISSFSVLKTARWPDQVEKQTLSDGETYFMRQVKELKCAEQREQVLNMIWRYRRPAGAIGLSILISVLSFWLRKSTGPSGFLGAFWRLWYGYQGH